MQFILLRSSAAEKAVYHLHRNIIIRKIHTGSELLLDVFLFENFFNKRRWLSIVFLKLLMFKLYQFMGSGENQSYLKVQSDLYELNRR